MRKKMAAVALAVCTTLSLAACGSGSGSALHHQTEAKLLHPKRQMLLRKREAQMQSPFAGVR
mgnify:CR=1 FL=1